jgi:hypothetical protein
MSAQGSLEEARWLGMAFRYGEALSIRARFRLLLVWLSIYQTLLTKPQRGETALPLTRVDWYRSADEAPHCNS